MSYLAQVDEGSCVAHGDCAEVAPAVFAVDDVARVVGDGSDAILMEAAEACPSAAIWLVDRDTGEQVYP